MSAAYRSTSWKWFAAFTLLTVGLGAGAIFPRSSEAKQGAKASAVKRAQAAAAQQRAESPGATRAQAAPRGTRSGPIVRRDLKHDTSIPLRAMRPIPPRQGPVREIPRRVLPKALASVGKESKAIDPAVDRGPVGNTMPATFQNFEGTGNVDGVLPPDTNGDVGPDHYVQWVNLSFQIFDKTGLSLYGPVDGSTLWQGFGGACETHNDGDPIALYDHLADRWFMSQFALYDAGNHYQCIAVSQTGDPLGAWHRYQFFYSATVINDYPHFGVWPDAYYMTANQFDESTFDWRGQGVMAFERDQMLNGAAAGTIYFDLFGVDDRFGGMLPSDLDGPPLPAGEPNIFMEVDDESVFGTDRLSLWEFHVDWRVPANSTFGINGQPNVILATDPFDWDMCGFSPDCIPQPDTAQGLDAISDRLMYRLQCRNFGDEPVLVANHTVDVDGTDHAGVRWYQLRDTGGGWVILQQGTWAPDNDHRWMGSVAMDSACAVTGCDDAGNIAVGYSVSSSTVYPSIRYAGRLFSDPLGQLSQGEAEIIAGSGSQTHPAARWGDYSMITVDQSRGDVTGAIDCDFWYTTEYIQTTGIAPWQTRIGAFSFAPGACGGGGHAARHGHGFRHHPAH